MHKVVRLHLAQRAYHVEEAGYDALHFYLDAAATARRNSGGTGDVDDLEERLADRCDALLVPPKTALTTHDVDEAIRGVSAETHTGSFAAAKQSPPKNFYRLREGSFIGGVCTGLAAYFNIPVLLLRCAFVLLALITGGGWILVYFTLMIMVPYASTQEEHARARGHSFGGEVLRGAKHLYARFEARGGERDIEGHMAAWRNEARDRMRFETPFLGSMGALIGSLLTLAWIFALLSVIATGSMFGWLLPSVPLWVVVLLLCVLYWALISPFRRASVFTRIRRSKPLEDLAWFLALIIGIWVLYTYVPFVHVVIDEILTAFSSAFSSLEAAVS